MSELSESSETTARLFRKGDRVEVVLTGAGVTTREHTTVAYVKKGIAYTDNGPGNDSDPYFADTGVYAREDFMGWSRRIVLAAASRAGEDVA